jgi:hypothetical protein
MMYGQIRTTAVICRPCKIFTFPFDPAFNKWRDSDKKIPCPHCQHDEVKWFLRHLDQYIKFVCPKCGIIGEGDCNALVKDDGSMDLELMEGSEQVPEETRIEIPVDKLNLPKNTKDKLKKKLRENREKGK